MKDEKQAQREWECDWDNPYSESYDPYDYTSVEESATEESAPVEMECVEEAAEYFFRIDKAVLHGTLNELNRLGGTTRFDITEDAITFAALTDGIEAVKKIKFGVKATATGRLYLDTKASKDLAKAYKQKTYNQTDVVYCTIDEGERAYFRNGSGYISFRISEAKERLIFEKNRSQNAITVVMKQAEFAERVDQSMYVLKDNLYKFRYINLQIKDGELAFKATNGYQLAFTSTEHFTANNEGTAEFWLNRAAILFAHQQLTRQGDIQITLDADTYTAVITFDDWTITSCLRFSDEKFPDIRPLLNMPAPVIATIDNRKELIQAINICAVVRDSTDSIILTFCRDEMIIERRNKHGESAAICLQATIAGTELGNASIVTSYPQLLDTLKSVGDKTVTLALTAKNLRVHESKSIGVISPLAKRDSEGKATKLLIILPPAPAQNCKQKSLIA